MKLGKRLDHGQPHASARTSAAHAVELVEHAAYGILGHAHARVGHRQHGFASAAGHAYRHRSALAVVFQGVAHEVVADAFHLIIICADGHFAVGLHIKRNARRCGQRPEIVNPQPYGVGKVELRHREFHFPGLYLAQVQYLAYQLQQQRGVAPDYAEHVPLPLREVLVVEDALHRVGYQRQRSAQVVAHVGEESHLRLGRLALHAPPYHRHAVENGEGHYDKHQYYGA